MAHLYNASQPVGFWTGQVYFNRTEEMFLIYVGRSSV